MNDQACEENNHTKKQVQTAKIDMSCFANDAIALSSNQMKNIVRNQSFKCKRKSPKKLAIHVGSTKYAIVKQIAHENFGLRLVTKEDSSWDIYWTDSYVASGMLAKMRGYQRINHFPGSENLGRKNLLAKNLNGIQKYLPKEYDFYPKTWILPYDMTALRQAYSQETIKVLISKPEASCQGKGIFLTKSIEEFIPFEHYVVQSYVGNPLLIDKLKFDMRIYVLITGCDPLTVYVYDKGIARFATVPYKEPEASNMKDCFMHLTNYAINKKSPAYKCIGEYYNSNSGHKRSLASIWEYLDSHGFSSKKIREDMNSLIIKTICTVQPMLAHLQRTCLVDQFNNKTCFEILGFDIMLDADGKPWLLEVNHTPSFSTETPYDLKLKSELIKDALSLVQITPQNKSKFLMQEAADIRKRLLGKRTRTKLEKCNLLIKQSGGFTLIYPANDFTSYTKHLNAAEQMLTELTQGKKIFEKKMLQKQLRDQITKQMSTLNHNKQLTYYTEKSKNRSRSTLRMNYSNGLTNQTATSPSMRKSARSNHCWGALNTEDISSKNKTSPKQKLRQLQAVNCSFMKLDIQNRSRTESETQNPSHRKTILKKLVDGTTVRPANIFSNMKYNCTKIQWKQKNNLHYTRGNIDITHQFSGAFEKWSSPDMNLMQINQLQLREARGKSKL